MTRDEVLESLRSLAGGEEDHMSADALLVAYIDDPEISEAYGNITKWYA